MCSLISYVYPIMCLRAILINIWHVLIQNIQQEILYLLFGVCYMSAGGHFRNVRRWLHPQICSLYIDLPLCQNWCFYQKMHNRLAYPHHYTVLRIMNVVCFYTNHTITQYIDWLSCGFTSHSTQHGSFRRRSQSQSLGFVLKNYKPSTTKARIHQSNEMYYNTK